MLWWKAWIESRTRFVLIALTLSAVCAFAVLFEPYVVRHRFLIPLHLGNGGYSEYVYRLIFAGTAKGVFALLVIFLGLGGLQMERARKAAGFTLALPVGRSRLVGTQIVVGVVELAILALVPTILIPGLSTFSHRSFPLPIALHFSVLWFFGGLVIFAASFLLSVVAPGEYTAPVACYLALIGHTYIAVWQPLISYRLNLLWVMGEFQTMRWNDAHSLLQPPPLSWPRMAIMGCFALLLLAAAIRVTDKQDF